MRKKHRFRMSAIKREAMTGYLMTAPAVILIFAVALFPVLRTFYLSTFDLRLNNAALSKTYTDYNIDLEYYADTYFRLNKMLGTLSKSESDTLAAASEGMRSELEAAKEELLSTEGLAESYSMVYESVLSMKSLNDEKLTIKKIKESSAGKLETSIENIISTLKPFSDDKDAKTTVEIAEDMKGALRTPNFRGLENYKTLLSGSRFWLALVNTVIFSAFAVIFELCLGILFGMLMNKSFKGRGIVRASILIPWSIPAAVSALMWRFMYDGQYGIVAVLFEKLGLFGSASDILTTKGGAMFGLIFADVWKTTPYMALMILAGLQTIDGGLYEASIVDGANKIQQFFRITLPLLKPSILVALLFRTLDTFKVFDLVSVLTNGGPSNSTETISVYAYKTLFANMNFGMGSAIAVIMFILLAAICIIYVKVLGADLLRTEG